MSTSSRPNRGVIPSFEEKLENEEEVVDALLNAFAKNQLEADVWPTLHQAAVRFDRVSELSFAYESISQSRKLKTQLPAVQAELFFRAATFFGDVLGDEFGAATYLEKALGAQPGHAGAFERIDAQLSRTGDHKKLAELCVANASHRQRPEQLELLKRAAVLFEQAGLDDKAIETYQQLVRLDPADEYLRNALEQRYVKANRFRDVARMLEQALAADPPLEQEEALRVRGKLIDVFAHQLKEPERAMPHVEAILDADPTNPDARRVATRLLESKGLAARAAAALAPGAATTEERARFLGVELENTRGPKRRDVLRRIGVLKQDELDDTQGALEAFEQALGIDPADDDLRRRYVDLGIVLKGPAEVARTFARVSTVAKDAGVRSRITAEMGELLLRAGDAKRARTTLAGVLSSATADPMAALTAARALAGVYEGENDAKNLVEVLTRVGEMSPDENERQAANERIAELATTELDDLDRAIAAWRRLVETPARARALAALEPLYEERGAYIDLSFVLEERAKDEPDRQAARELSYRAAEILTTKAKDVTSAHESWRRMIDTYGPSRDVLAQWMPLLEQQRLWSELAGALAKDAELAPREERPAILARLGTVYLQRTKEVDLAIEAFQSALLGDPNEKTSRATLEKLLLTPEHRVAAAGVLEPVYRDEDNAQGLLRVLEIRADGSPVVAARLTALEEAADVAAHVSRDKAVEIVARGLAEAIQSGEPITRWLTRFDVLAADGLDAKRRAALLAKALGDREIDSVDLLSLARRVGEEHANAGDVAAALAAYRRALAYEPSSVELINRVDVLLQEQGNPEERVALYRAALERGPDALRRKQLLHSIGSIERYELLNPDSALLAYNRALKDDPGDHEAFKAVAELYRETEAWDLLCDVLEAHLEFCRAPEEGRATRAELADVAASHGQPDRAALHAGALLNAPDLGAEELDLVERVAQAISDTNLLRGALERRVRDSGDARVQVQSLERLADLAKQAGDRAHAVERLRQAADIARGLGEDAQAIGILARLREIDPRDALATAQLVELHERAEAFAEVPDLYAVLLELAASSSERVALLRRLAGVRADHLDDVRGAFDATRSAFTLAPEDADVLGELVALAIRAGRATELAEAVDQALVAVGSDPSLLADLTIAKARVLATDPSLVTHAADAYRSVLERAPSDEQRDAAVEGFAALLRGIAPSDERTADIRWLHEWQVEHVAPELRARAFASWAAAEENEIGDPAAALATYRKVLELDENDYDALDAVSRLSLALGDVEGALSALTARRAGSDGEARNVLDVQIANILASRPGRAAEALDRIAGVLEVSPHDTGALDLAARLLQDQDVAPRAAEILEKSLDAVESAETKIAIFEQLVAQSHRPGGSAPRRDLYERFFDTLHELGQPAVAYDVALRAVRDLPGESVLWDRAENVARQLSSPEPLADTYEEVLKSDLPKEQCLDLGQRAVAFYEEWYEDNERVVRVLERLLDVEPDDGWAFDRLKLIFDANERWEDLFKLYDRAAKTADRARKIELFEEAAQIAKDFASHSQRAIGYLEQLLELKPGNTRLSAQLERLYERHGCHRELIGLLGSRVESLPLEEAQRERARMAALWLEEIGDAANALLVVEDILENQPEGVPITYAAPPPRQPGRASLPPPPPAMDVTELLERVLAVAPPNAEVRASMLPPAPADDGKDREREGRRDSYAPKRTLVRQRAAALLKERYKEAGHEADLARVLEVELEAVKSVKERIRRHKKIAGIYAQLGNDESAVEHFVQLVLLEPEVAAHRTELSTLAGRIGRWDRLTDVLVSAADDQADDALRVELLMQAGVVTADKIGAIDRAIELFFRILSTNPIVDEALLEACRHVEPLLAQSGRKTDRLDVLERLALLESDDKTRWEVLGEAARLAMELDEDDRAIWAWQGRLETAKLDPEALDGLCFLFERNEKWRPLIEALEKRAKLDTRDADDRRRDRVRVASILSEKLDAVEEAIATWTDVQEKFGPSDEGTRALAALYRGTKQWKELAELLAAAAERGTSPTDKAETLRELGDVQRGELDDAPSAIASYELALTGDPRNEGAREGLRSLLRRSELRVDLVRVLLAAYVAADDWKLILEITEHRLGAAADAAAQVAILMEGARISETRAEDIEAAFALVRRALLLDPSDATTVEEIFRLAEATRAWRALADALRECIESPDGRRAAWAPGLRYRMGEVLETKLDEARAALDAYVQVAQEDTKDLVAARSVVRVAGKTSRWDAAARAVVDGATALEELPSDLTAAIEEAASAHGGWDAVTSALASLVAERNADGSLEPNLARDLEAAIAAWHRDRRGDPEAAEAAFTRALTHDASNPRLLADLAQLQRRVRGRPLVDSLLRLSQSTGGDLDLLSEASETALASVGDRALAKSILDRLLKLGAERWLGATEPNVSSGTPQAPEAYVEKATRELVRLWSEDGDHDKVVQLLVDTSHLPWRHDESRKLRHEGAKVAVDKLGANDRAVGIYLGLIDEDPHDDEAVKRLVAIYEAGSRTNELLELKRRLVATARSVEERLDLRLDVATLEDAMGNPAKAIDALQENLAESSRHEPTVKQLITLFTRDGRIAELEATLAGQARLADDSGDGKLAADLYVRAAEVAEVHMKDVPRAIEHLRRVIELEARPPALDTLARLSTETKDHVAAAGYLDRLRELVDDRARAGVVLRLAEALTLANKKADARTKLEEEIGRDPESDRVRVKLAEVYRAAQDWPALAELLSDGAHHAPDKPTRLARLREAAELHRAKTGQPERAIPLLEQAADLSPDENAVKLALADALGAAGRFEEARSLLRTLVEAFGGRRPKERAPVHYHLARLDLALGDRARALVELDAATKIDPANAEILRALAELARDDGQLDRAERSYRALLTVLRRQDAPDEDAAITRSEVLFELSHIATRQGEPDRAKEILESAFELCAENIIEALRLEGALRTRGEHLSLARALESRLARGSQPDEAAIYAELGRLYDAHLGKATESFEMWMRALDLEPDLDETHEKLYRIAKSLGRVEDYEKRVRGLADKHEADVELSAMLYVRVARIAESDRHDDREAVKFYERAVEVHPRSRDILSSLSGVYERLGDDAGQARVLGVIVELDAEEAGAAPDTLYRLAQLRFKSNDVEAACDAFEQAYDLAPDFDRGEELLKGAADRHPENARIIDIYERIARAANEQTDANPFGGGRERSLVDALVRRWSLPGATTEPMREAVQIADQVEDKALAESLLRRYLEKEHEDKEGRVWALSLLAFHCEAASNVREAVLLKREAAELAEPADARRLLFEVAGLASGPLADLRLAATIYEELHEREPTDRDAWEMLLDVYRRTNEYDKLTALIQGIVQYVDEPTERSKLRLERVKVGMEKLRLSDDDAAVELREIVDDDPAAVDAAILLGSLLERGGREDDLAALLAKQLDAAKDRQDGDAVSSLSRRLGELLEKRDRQQAKDVYYAALDWDPKAKDILVALERIHDEDLDIEARSDVMEKRLALETGPEAEQLALDLSETRRSLDDAAGSLRALEIGFASSPESNDLKTRLEAIYREQLEFEKLAKLFEVDARARTDAKQRSARLRDAAQIWQNELSDPEQASRVLREAREADPNDPLLLGELIDTLTASGELKAAVDELTAAIATLEADDTVRTDYIGRRAILRSRLNDHDGALADFDDAVAKGKLDLRPYLAEHLGKMALAAAGRGDAQLWRTHRLRVAELRLAMNDVEEARNVLTELLKTDSKDRATLRAIAHVDELEERWDAASATYRRLVGLEEGEHVVIAALKLAETCEKAGRLADARGGLERARAANPDNEELRERVKWLYEQLGALKELAELVLEEARAAGDVGPRFDGLMRAGQLFLEAANDPNSTQQLGAIAAVAPLEEAHALRPADLDCSALLSDSYVSAGRFDDAQTLLTGVIATFKGRRARELSALYHRLARIAEVLGDRNAELQHLVTALDMDSQNGIVASELSYLAMELGNLEVAQRALRQITMLKTAAPLPKALAYQHLGEIAKSQGDNKRAMMLLKRAVDEDPNLESARAIIEQIQAGA